MQLRGLMQITEETFQWIRFRMKDESGASYDDLFDEKINIQYGTFLLKTLLDEFGSEANALCAYHAGWGNAKSGCRAGNMHRMEKISRISRLETPAGMSKK